MAKSNDYNWPPKVGTEFYKPGAVFVRAPLGDAKKLEGLRERLVRYLRPEDWYEYKFVLKDKLCNYCIIQNVDVGHEYLSSLGCLKSRMEYIVDDTLPKKYKSLW